MDTMFTVEESNLICIFAGESRNEAIGSAFSIMSSYYRQMSRYNTPAFFPLILADKIVEWKITGIMDNKTFSMR